MADYADGVWSLRVMSRSLVILVAFTVLLLGGMTTVVGTPPLSGEAVAVANAQAPCPGYAEGGTHQCDERGVLIDGLIAAPPARPPLRADHGNEHPLRADALAPDPEPPKHA